MNRSGSVEELWVEMESREGNYKIYQLQSEWAVKYRRINQEETKE
jgi:hypothetical protein